MLTPFTRSDVFVQFTLLLASAANGFSSSMSSSSSSSTHQCAVVGVGVLGTSLCRQILETTETRGEDWQVIGITQTTNRHESIRQSLLSDTNVEARGSRLTLLTRADVPADTKYDNVVFCAPPSGSEDYPGAVKDAVDNLWKGPDSGVFCFTSSGGVYAAESGTVTETTPVGDLTPRSERLVKAEQVVTKAGGCVLRLAGLYLLQRGAHSFYLSTDKPIQGNPAGLINLLHYDDAAGACLVALKAGPEVCRGQVFLISDGQPQTRTQICESTLKSAVYRGHAMPTFESEPDPTKPGKVYDGSQSNKALNWKPKYESFAKFMEANQ